MPRRTPTSSPKVSGILKAHAVSLLKISSDLRIAASGPDAGFGELKLPPRQVGSSIMPAKVNPVIPEAVSQVAMLTFGYDQTIAQACAAGNFELNPFLPLVAACLLESLDLLARADQILKDFCIDSLAADERQCRRHVESATATATAIIPRSGYTRRPAAWPSRAHREGVGIRQAVTFRKPAHRRGVFNALIQPEAVCRLGSPEEVSGTLRVPFRCKLAHGVLGYERHTTSAPFRQTAHGVCRIRRAHGVCRIRGRRTHDALGCAKGSRLHIGLFGRRNVGKSSLLNCLARQEVSIVSELPGTTTDPVEKPMGTAAAGPGAVHRYGRHRRRRGLGRAAGGQRWPGVSTGTELAVLVADASAWAIPNGNPLQKFRQRRVPAVVVFNKIDLCEPPVVQPSRLLWQARRLHHGLLPDDRPVKSCSRNWRTRNWRSSKRRRPRARASPNCARP